MSGVKRASCASAGATYCELIMHSQCKTLTACLLFVFTYAESKRCKYLGEMSCHENTLKTAHPILPQVVTFNMQCFFILPTGDFFRLIPVIALILCIRDF